MYGNKHLKKNLLSTSIFIDIIKKVVKMVCKWEIVGKSGE